MSEKEQATAEIHAPRWLWQSSVFLFIIVLVTGLGLAGALALGWRSPLPRRAPDWTATDLVWRQYGVGTGTISDQGYRMHLSVPDQRAWAIADLSIADFELEMHSLAPDVDVDYGLFYRFQDPDNTCLFAIGSDGYYTIAILRAGKVIPLHDWQQWPHIRRGAATNRLRVRCAGTLCRFYINGEFTAAIEDDTFTSGKIGLWAQNFSDDALDIVFSGLRLWSLD